MSPGYNEETWTHRLNMIIATLDSSATFSQKIQMGVCVCDRIIPAHMYLYCNPYKNWHRHYMGSIDRPMKLTM